MNDVPVSLWCIPEPRVLPALHYAIHELSRKFGGPIFPPHITLLSQINDRPSTILQPLARLAEHLPPFDVVIAGIRRSEEVFRAVVVEFEPCEALHQAWMGAQQLFSSQSRVPYSPHLSLAYGHVDESAVNAARDALRELLPDRFLIGALALVRAGSKVPVGKWRPLRIFPLRGTPISL